MTDVDLVEKKLARIETLLRQLRELANPGRIEEDVREERFVLHTLQLAIQGALDVASHIVSDDRLGEPANHRELFALLARGGWIEPVLADPLRQMTGFRNILVHEYDTVDLRIVRDILEHRLGDLDRYVAAIRGRLGAES